MRNVNAMENVRICNKCGMAFVHNEYVCLNCGECYMNLRNDDVEEYFVTLEEDNKK